MRIYFVLLASLFTLQQLKAEETRLLDLEPSDAQNLIDQQDQSLKYAPKIKSDVPAVRFLGPEPHNVLEDIYLAKQYHGQDGVGGYLYGYQVPDIAKNEQKKPSGDLKGAYNYVNGAGQEIKVEYWDDGTGFHQNDNVAEILPQDSPEVKAVKDEFLKRWAEEAERNTHPVETPYNSEGQYASGPLSVQGQKERAQFFATLPPQPKYIQPQSQPQQQYQTFITQKSNSANHEQYQAAASIPREATVQLPNPPPVGRSSNPESQDDGSYTADEEGKYIPGKDEESTGPPKGFFYAFDYPVGIITKDQGRALPVGQDASLKNVYEQNKQRFERQLSDGHASGSSQYLIH
ncbi:uncharacterized protein Cpr67B [Euwallacea fornicatus]|uniref:uncharacterized protein Cpr67B n=1 Tax=Euwallacea fornicatus TaxID=995702 RepID=UPI00338DF6C8